MFRFISSLFAPSETRSTDLDEALINEAIERAVDGTDTRLRAVSDYRKRLRQPAIRAVEHIVSLVDGIAPATELSPAAYSDDPRLKAFFASPQRVSEIAGNFPSIKQLRRSGSNRLPDRLYGLLSMQWSERTVLGMGLVGDQVRRGVSQVVVNFSDHRFLRPSATEEETRDAIKRGVYDYVVSRALGQLADMREQRNQLREQRTLLNRKFDCLNKEQWGLESMFSAEEKECPNEALLEAEIEALNAELEELGGDTQSLDVALDLVADTLNSVEDWLSVNPLEMYLDYRGVKVTAPDASGINALQLTEVRAHPNRQRIILMCYLPRSVLPDEKDFLREAERLLY